MVSLKVLNFIASHPLNKGRKARAFMRYARWQIGSRLVGAEIVQPWVNGSRFFVRRGETGITGNIYAGLQEFPDMGFLLHALREDDLFVDVGANVGSYTILACAAVGARGWAFEPVPSTYRRLDDNIRLNRLEARVRHLNVGIGREPGTIAFTSELDTVNHALADGEHCTNAIKVEVRTLNGMLGATAPSLMKIDVEGFEMPVLEGASEILSNDALHSVIMELNGSGSRYGYCESRIVELMRGYGFGTYSYDPIGRRLIDLGGKSLAEGNTLFVRNPAVVAEKLRASPQLEIFGKLF